MARWSEVVPGADPSVGLPGVAHRLKCQLFSLVSAYVTECRVTRSDLGWGLALVDAVRSRAVAGEGRRSAVVTARRGGVSACEWRECSPDIHLCTQRVRTYSLTSRHGRASGGPSARNRARGGRCGRSAAGPRPRATRPPRGPPPLLPDAATVGGRGVREPAVPHGEMRAGHRAEGDGTLEGPPTSRQCTASRASLTHHPFASCRSNSRSRSRSARPSGVADMTPSHGLPWFTTRYGRHAMPSGCALAAARGGARCRPTPVTTS